MSSKIRAKSAAAAALLAAAGALTSMMVAPGVAQAGPNDRATGPFTWCPGQHQGFAGSGPDRPNWDWNVCHTYWWVYADVPLGNVATSVYEGEFPPMEVPFENMSRPPFNCGLFYCQDPGGRYETDPRIPAP